jgi:hypothetical protein
MNEKISYNPNEKTPTTACGIENETTSSDLYNLLDSFFDKKFKYKKSEKHRSSYNPSLGQIYYFNKGLEANLSSEDVDINIILVKDEVLKKFIVSGKDFGHEIEVFPKISRKKSRENEQANFNHTFKNLTQYPLYPTWTKTLEENETEKITQIFENLKKEKNAKYNSFITSNG